MVTIAAQILTGLAGAFAGTALTGSADHFTRDRSLWPIPACPGCGARRPAPAWVPVAGPLLTVRCAACDAPGAWRFWVLVQCLATALGVLLLRQYGFGAEFASASVESWVLLAVGVIDLQHRLIPTLLVYPSVVFAVACSGFWPDLGLLVSLEGAGLAFGLFFALALIARLAFGEGALGDGDVTLAALIGAICGYPMVVLALALGALAGGLGAALMLILRRSPLGTTIPYGPYLVAGALYVLVSGNTTHPLYALV